MCLILYTACASFFSLLNLITYEYCFTAKDDDDDDDDDDESSDDEYSTCSSKVSKPPARSKRGDRTKPKGKKMERGTYLLPIDQGNRVYYILYVPYSIDAYHYYARIRQSILVRAR